MHFLEVKKERIGSRGRIDNGFPSTLEVHLRKLKGLDLAGKTRRDGNGKS